MHGFGVAVTSITVGVGVHRAGVSAERPSVMTHGAGVHVGVLPVSAQTCSSSFSSSSSLQGLGVAVAGTTVGVGVGVGVAVGVGLAVGDGVHVGMLFCTVTESLPEWLWNHHHHQSQG